VRQQKARLDSILTFTKLSDNDGGDGAGGGDGGGGGGEGLGGGSGAGGGGGGAAGGGGIDPTMAAGGVALLATVGYLLMGRGGDEENAKDTEGKAD
jgi:hypothetical protein